LLVRRFVMVSFRLVLMIIGLLLLILAGLNFTAPRVNFLALGLACWLLALLVVA
jgi:hypothetical protein